MFAAAREDAAPNTMALPQQPASSTVLPQAPLSLIHPFATLNDFEQAEIFSRWHAGDGFIDDQLRCKPSIGFKNAREMHSILQSSLLYNESGEV